MGLYTERVSQKRKYFCRCTFVDRKDTACKEEDNPKASSNGINEYPELLQNGKRILACRN